MSRFYAGQDPAGCTTIARSVRLAGHATSIRLEATFWNILDEIAADQDLTTPRFLSRLYDEALERDGEISNFTSLLRVACVRHLQASAPMPRLAEPVLEHAAAE